MNPVVISLTSFPAAINYAEQAVRSLLQGSVLPDKIVLYLTFSQFEHSEIPQSLKTLSQENSIFEIRNYDEEIRSYRKLIPALQDFPNATIITVDDDVWYHKNMLRDLLNLHQKFPNVVIANRAKKIKFDAPYRTWKKYRWYHFLTKKINISFQNIATGVGGVLYPPNALSSEMLDSRLFREIAPSTDDIWFWAAAVAKGTKIMPFPFGRYNKPKALPKPKNLSLKSVNVNAGADLNRRAFEKIIEKYPIIKQRIDHEN